MNVSNNRPVWVINPTAVTDPDLQSGKARCRNVKEVGNNQSHGSYRIRKYPIFPVVRRVAQPRDGSRVFRLYSEVIQPLPK